MNRERAAPRSVLHVVAPAPFGGLESVVRALANGHRARGRQVHVAAILSLKADNSPDEHPFVKSLRLDGTPVTALEIGTRDYLGERAAVTGLCRTLAIDVVHTHGFRPDVVDAQAARRSGLRTVSTVHGFIGRTLRGRGYEWLQCRALRRVDAVAAVSRQVQERLLREGIADTRVHLLPNAFSPRADLLSRATAREHLGIADERLPVIGWVGRLSAEKGPDIALRAMTRMGIPHAVLALIGDGRERDALRALADSLGVGDRIRWLGAMPDAARFFRAFDAFLLSSRTEGLPIALLEAMAANVPVIATRVGGVPDALGADGWIVPPEDPQQLADALEQRFAEPGLALLRAAAARSRIETQLAVAPWLASYDALYDAGTPANI